MNRRIEHKSSNKNTIRNQRRIQRRNKAILTFVMKCLCISAIVTVLFSSLYTSAHNNRTEEPVNFKYYKSIVVESGDSLWSIAEEYMTEDSLSIEEYINVLKDINHLKGDRIQAGQSLVIVYNDTNFIK